MKVLKKGSYDAWKIGSTPVGTVIQDLIDIIGEEYNTDDPSLEAALCETLDAWVESGQADLAGLGDNIRLIIEVSGKVANNIMWYLIKIECREGRVSA